MVTTIKSNIESLVGSLIMIEIITDNKMVFMKYWASRFV